MVKRMFALMCLMFVTIYANESIDQNQAPLPTKDEIIATLSADDFNPRSLQIIANAFYWSYEFKKAALAALQTSKKNMLLAHNILFMTHNQEFASDERVSKTFTEFHKTWKQAQAMQNAQNACVGILSFKQDINEIANIILTIICTDSLTCLHDKKQTVLALANTLNPAQAQSPQESAQCLTALQDFYTAVDSHDINVVHPALRSVKNQMRDRMHKHLSTAHTMNDINTDIVMTIETHFAQALFDWYTTVYTIMNNRGLLNTPYGTIMCDQNGLIEEDQRATLLPKPENLVAQ